MKSPERGEVWLVDLGMAAKVRPALVISVPAAEAGSCSPEREGTWRRVSPRDHRKVGFSIEEIANLPYFELPKQ
jgi:mRNA-degrading endonuclease toxin of MazEF toxin-antitoxin module